MCSVQTDLCRNLIEDFFGLIVAKVAKFLCENGWQSLKSITVGLKFKRDQVRKSLCVLIQHKLAEFQVYKGTTVEYRCCIDRILKLSFYPKIIYTAKLLYGDAAELIVEETLQHGIILMSMAIQNVSERLQSGDSENATIGKVKNAFNQLVQSHFIKREPFVDEPEEEEVPQIIPSLQPNINDLFTVPVISDNSLKRKFVEDDNLPQAKRQKTDDTSKSTGISPAEDVGIYWSVNIERFDQFLRDQTIVTAIGKKFGSNCGEVVRAMLRISEVTTSATAIKTQPTSPAEIVRNLPKTCKVPVKHVEQHLRLVTHDDQRMVELYDDSGAGGSYVINLKNCAKALATATVLSYVQERFGSKCCRIFRLLMMKKHLEQKQVEEFAMIQGKEAKGYLYNLLAENMIVMQEIPRTPDHAPSRTFYLFAVDLHRVSRMLLMRSYKTISNLINRQRHCANTNKRLLEKQARINAIKESLPDGDAAQLEEIDEMITALERSQLAKYEHCSDKLNTAQTQVLETVFALRLYLESLPKNVTAVE